MKKLFYLSVLFLASCSPKYVIHYTLITNEPLPVHGPNSLDDTRFEDTAIGDTIEYFAKNRRGELVNSAPVRYRTMEVFTSGLLTKARVLSKQRIPKREFASFHYDYSQSLYRKYFHLYGYKKPIERTYQKPALRSTSTPLYSTPTSGATIHTGPRGGRYYINKNGNKTYIKK